MAQNCCKFWCLSKDLCQYYSHGIKEAVPELHTHLCTLFVLGKRCVLVTESPRIVQLQ